MIWKLFFWLGLVFSLGINQQHREEKPVMDNMSNFDSRLPNKTYVWGIDIGDDAVDQVA